VKFKGEKDIQLITSACELIGVSPDEFLRGVGVASAKLIIEEGGIPESASPSVREEMERASNMPMSGETVHE
jgi:hypothetical protein